MQMRIERKISAPFRDSPSFEERWKGDDKGLITCWEVGRRLAQSDPELAEKAKNGELPVLGWKGGVEKEIKKKEKYGTHFYLAQWQGLRGEDLDVDTNSEPTVVCTRTGMTVVFTGDVEKYANA